MKISELVAKYVEVRDKKAQMKAEYDGKIAKVDEVLDKIEAALLKTFETTGMDSVRTEFGTAYTSTKTTASIADPDAFMTFCKENDAWHMLQKRCAQAAVEQYKDEHEVLPPGIDWRVEKTVNIRRS
jgi:ribosomal protein S24E